MWILKAEHERARELLGSYAKQPLRREMKSADSSFLGRNLIFKLFNRRKNLKRAVSFERDYPAFLLSLASGVRTGLDPLTALCACKALFHEDSEVRKEIVALNKAIDGGGTEEQVVRNFAASIPHPDLPLFRSAFSFARKEGSSLGETLQRLARITRQRQSFRRKVRAAVAMQKLSAFGIVLCTFVIGAIQALTNPAALSIAWASPLGSKAIVTGLSLVGIGMGWMLGLTRSRF